MKNAMVVILLLVCVCALAALGRRFLAGLSRAVRALDRAWDYVLNDPSAVGDEDRAFVEFIKDRLSDEDREAIKSQLNAVDESSSKLRGSENQLEAVRSAIMEETDRWKLGEEFRKLDEPSRRAVEQKLGDNFSDSSSTLRYFCARFRFWVLRYFAFFRHNDMAPNDWWTLYRCYSQTRQRMFVQVLKKEATAGSSSEEKMKFLELESVLTTQRHELLSWAPRAQVADDVLKMLEAQNADDSKTAASLA
jgi:hypothetical protein